MKSISTVLILGCGYLGEAVARFSRAHHERVIATVRSDARAVRLREAGFEVIAAPSLTGDLVAPLVGADVHVVVAFPPDGTTDAQIAPRLSRAAALTYVSSTSVYGDLRGDIDDTTAVPASPSERGARLLAAEEAWRAVGATVLRCPAIYGRDRGLHRRVIRGEHRIAGDGSAFTSRIHVEDLAKLVVATRAVTGETFVVGDLAPATQREICSFIANEYGVPMPPSVPVEEVHESLRADRRIDGSRALRVLGVTLAYPRYADGMSKGQA